MSVFRALFHASSWVFPTHTYTSVAIVYSTSPRPFSRARSFKARMRSGYSPGAIHGGSQPVANSAAMSTDFGPPPPTQIGGNGFCTGFGLISVSGKLMNFPL